MSGSCSLPEAEYDAVLVGGGLQNALISLFLLEQQAGLRVCLVEQSARVGGNHTWCFHAGDVSERAARVVAALVVHRWASYDVVFPGLERTLDEPYSAITSERLAEVVEARFAGAPGSAILTGARAEVVEANRVTLRDGRELTATCVVDARGPQRFGGGEVGFQKFVGCELEGPHGFERPVLMDATVPQLDGYRFMYVLPLGTRRCLIEDTYFSDGPALDVARVRDRVLAYADRAGLTEASIVREEAGVLPMPLRRRGDDGNDVPFRAGYAGGWFHPTTAYSFPVALRLAEHFGATPLSKWFGAGLDELVARHRRQFRFATFLNQLLFTGFAPEDRWNVLERFYRLPAGTIRRFYALDTTSADRLRVLCGRPPRGLSIPSLYRGALS